MSDAYAVCRVEDIKTGDVIIEPWSGVLALVKATKRLEAGIRPWRLQLEPLVSRSRVDLELPDKRLLRRQLRPGERPPAR